MQELDTSSVDFSNAYATLCMNVFEGITKDKLTSKSEKIQKKKIQPLQMDASFALMKLEQVLACVQVSRSTWLEGVRIGRYPAPVRISQRQNRWRTSDIQKFIDSL